MPEPGPLRYAVLEITNRCNLRCPHCGSTSGEARAGELTLAELRALVRELRSLGCEEVTVLGGEALLRPDWLEIARAVRDEGLDLVLITNGLLLRRDYQLRALRDLAPRIVGVSLDGASRETYRALRGVDGFDHCVGLLERLRDDGHENVNAITTFVRANLPEFDDFVRLFDGRRINWQVQLGNRGGRLPEEQLLTRQDYGWLTRRMRDALVERPETLWLCPMDDFGYFPLDPALAFLHRTWRGCAAGLEVVGVRSNGDVLPCLSLGDAFVVGNLRRTPLRELWRADLPFGAFRRKREALRGECALCPHGPVCRAGCSAMAWSATGHIGRNPYCIRSLEIAEILADL